MSKSTFKKCALCQRNRNLCKSHIIPEFLFTPVYDEHHRFFQYSTNSSKKVPRQKGIWEYLLCSECEAKLNPWETYANKIMFGEVTLKCERDVSGFTAHGIDYETFKLFQMSLLWRAGASSRPEFAAVNLGPHEDLLRRLLLSKNPGKFYEYGCLMVSPPERRALEVFNRSVCPPNKIKSRGHHLYRFMISSIMWLFFVSNHMSNLKDDYWSLYEDGTLKVRNGGAPIMKYLRRFAVDMSTANAEG